MNLYKVKANTKYFSLRKGLFVARDHFRQTTATCIIRMSWKKDTSKESEPSGSKEIRIDFNSWEEFKRLCFLQNAILCSEILATGNLKGADPEKIKESQFNANDLNDVINKKQLVKDFAEYYLLNE